MFLPQNLMFLSSIILSIMLILSSPSMMISWVALELNTLSFIPIILSNKKINDNEAAVKYFLSQTLASVILIISVSTPLYNSTMMTWSSFLFTSAIMIKLGAAPLHSWLPSMVERLSWSSLFILLTLQKLNPLLLLMMTPTTNQKFLYLFVMASLSIGAMMGLAQTQSRKIITYSSINHVGWLISTSLINLYMMMMYFMSYAIILLPVMQFLNVSNLNKIHQMNMNMNSQLSLLLALTLLSLGGLPPFLGFLPKWMILQNAISLKLFLTSTIMILSSLFTLAFYLRLSFSSFIMNKNNWMMFNKNTPINKTMLILTSISLSGLSMSFLV